MIARGTFDVNLQPMEPFVAGREGIRFSRLSIDKTFSGDLDGKSQGEMLSALSRVDGSAGYVALEQVQGALAGKRGTFVLQHYGISKRGETRLVLEVVPDSGTGQLARLSGSMTIRIEGGLHLYEFDYLLAWKPLMTCG